ncbi:MAG: hypothetical protein HY319_10665 [Armatimonadetes bacterium]|nr:hypothetical protein [Armatimonadota bacterium]
MDWRAESRRALGFTLIEVLLAAALFLLTLGLVFSVLVPGMRSYSRGSDRAELQQMAALATRRILADLEAAAPGSVGLLSSSGAGEPEALGLVRLQDVSPAGRQVWEEQAIVYYWIPAEGNLVRKLWPPAPPQPVVPMTKERPPTIFPSLLREIVQQSNGTETMVAARVARFRVRSAGVGPGVVQPLKLELLLERLGGSGTEQFELTRDIYLRNSL